MKTLPLIFLVMAAAQAQQPAFEVASVRQSPPEALLESYVPTLDVAPGTTLRIQNRQLKELIMIAYGIGGRQIAGPQWLVDPPGRASDVPHFDIVAKVPSNAKRDQIPAMLGTCWRNDSGFGCTARNGRPLFTPSRSPKPD